MENVLDSNPTVTDCTFSGNTAYVFGGGMKNDSSNPMVTDCTFSGNTAADGGGMYNYSSTPTVNGCVFSGNTAEGGFAGGGGMCNNSSNLTVSSCLFSGNTARGGTSGGGMYNESSSPTVINCTFSGNRADSSEGGGIYCDDPSGPTITNCILWDNSSPITHREDFFDSGKPFSLVSYSYIDDIYNVSGVDVGGGNIDGNPDDPSDDPYFVDPGYWDNNGTPSNPDDDIWVDGDYHLTTYSLCRDAGDNAAVTGTTDLDGNPRVSHLTVDMGAYEFQDDDGDGVVDSLDVCPGFNDNLDDDADGVPNGCDICSGFDDNLDDNGNGIPNGCDVCPGADYSGDCKVNLDDYAIMALAWLTSYDSNDLADMAFQWLDDNSAFMTTWDTSLGFGTTVTLALAGTVDAVIDWGDGSDPNYVTTPGPHVHSYSSNGTYTVSVTGTVTAYNSLDHGGGTSERAKLISVDSWGYIGFTNMHNAFNYCTNLTSVPAAIYGLEAVSDMSRMFMLASSFDADISGWDTSGVTDMSGIFYDTPFNQNISGWDTSNVTSMYWMFFDASLFNQPIGGWDTSNVTDMDLMFYGASVFDQDLSGWCVTNIPSKPTNFDIGTLASWEESEKPVWGTCPP